MNCVLLPGIYGTLNVNQYYNNAYKFGLTVEQVKVEQQRVILTPLVEKSTGMLYHLLSHVQKTIPQTISTFFIYNYVQCYLHHQRICDGKITSKVTSLLLLYVNKVFVMDKLHLLYNSITMLVYLIGNIHQLNYSITFMGL